MNKKFNLNFHLNFKEIFNLNFLFLLIQLFFIQSLLSSCGWMVVRIENLDQPNSASSNPQFVRPSNPTAPNIKNGGISPTSINTLVIEVGQLSPDLNHTLKIYKNSDCSEELTSLSITNTTHDIQISNLSDSNYHFSAKVFNINNDSSDCISNSQDFIIDTISPTINLLNPNQVYTNTGGTISISGSHFTTDITIMLGEQACSSVLFINSNLVQCFAQPYSENSVNLRITKYNSNSAELVNALKYETPYPKYPVCVENNFFKNVIDTPTNFYLLNKTTDNLSKMGQCKKYSTFAINNSTGIEDPQHILTSVKGEIKDIISDNNGGYFIGGRFNEIANQVRYNLAYVHSDGHLDNIIGVTSGSFDGEVQKLIFDKNTNDLYTLRNYIPKNDEQQADLIQQPITSGFINITEGTVNFNTHKIVGIIISSVSDGNGGFYISGNLSFYNNIPVSNVIHILGDGTLDLVFSPPLRFSQAPPSIAYHSTGLYLSGSDYFTTNFDSRPIIKLDKVTGATLPFNYTFTGASNIYGIESTDNLIVYNDILIFAGDFGNIDGYVRRNLAAIDLTTGTLLNWAPNTNTYGYVKQLLIANDELFVTGYFNTISSTTRNGIASYNLLNWTLTSFHPTIDNSTQPKGMAQNSSDLFIFGKFTTVNGQSRNGLCSFDISTKSLKNLNINFVANSDLKNAIADNNFLYLGGPLQLNSEPTPRFISRINLTSGSIEPSWGKSISFSDKYNTSTPQINLILFLSDKIIFTSDDSQTMIFSKKKIYELSKLNINNGTFFKDQKIELQMTTFNYTQPLKAIEYDSNSKYFFLGGYFSTINGYNQKSIFGIDFSVTTPTLLNWFPQITFMGSEATINTLQIHNNSLFIGGIFNNVINLSNARSGIAEIDLTSGTFTNWAPQIDSYINKIKIYNDEIMISGLFTSVNSSARKYFATFDIQSRNLTTTSFDFDNAVDDFILSNNVFYWTGDFNYLSSLNRSCLAAYSNTDLRVKDWNPKLSTKANKLFAHNNSIIALTNNATIDSKDFNHLLNIDRSTGDAIPSPINMSRVFALSQKNTQNEIYFYGVSDEISGGTGLMKLNLSTGSTSSLPLTIDSNDYGLFNFNITFAPDDSELFISGEFSQINGVPRGSLASLMVNAQTLSNWNPDIKYFSSTGEIKSTLVFNNQLFIFGSFNKANGLTRTKHASFDLPSKTLNSWAYNSIFNDVPPSVAQSATEFFIPTSDLSTINGIPFNMFVKFDSNGNLDTSYNVSNKIDYYDNIYSIAYIANKLYVQGDFNYIGGIPKNNLAEINSTTAAPTAWNPNFCPQSSNIYGFISSKNYLIAATEPNCVDSSGTIRTFMILDPLTNNIIY